ncbi:hypothetical protein BC332_31603 [Capsicum chinense]|nr:hypothetical protein BC332_31603 [Capsicum chinense]
MNNSDREWMYDRLLGDEFINPKFIDGVEIFLEFAKSHSECMDGEKLRCPCNNRGGGEERENGNDEDKDEDEDGDEDYDDENGDEKKDNDDDEEEEEEEEEEEFFCDLNVILLFSASKRMNMSGTPSLVAGSPDTPGSIDSPGHISCWRKATEMDREPNSWEIFKKLHLKKDGSFVDAKSMRINGMYSTLENSDPKRMNHSSFPLSGSSFLPS